MKYQYTTQIKGMFNTNIDKKKTTLSVAMILYSFYIPNLVIIMFALLFSTKKERQKTSSFISSSV